MPELRIIHTTHYRYASAVRFTTHRLMLRPRDSHDLVVTDATLGITPPAAVARWAHDVFGNSICYLDFGEAESEALCITSTLDLQHFPSDMTQPRATLDPQAEIYPFRYAAEEFPDLARSLERHHADPERRIDNWAARFLPKTGTIRTLDLLTAITESIHQDFAYEGRDAEGTNPPLVTLDTGRGACRDFALLMMEAVRSLGFAARFVSGYLYDASRTDDDAPMVGGGATHAWCSVYLPGAGWVEFDPTNGLMAGQNLIRVCSARTPEQAVPVAGGFLGRPGDFIGLEVSVEVTVHGANHATPASPGDDHAGLNDEDRADPVETEPVTKPE
jgi:transglutaminase-like putative cysteine protease